MRIRIKDATNESTNEKKPFNFDSTNYILSPEEQDEFVKYFENKQNKNLSNIETLNPEFAFKKGFRKEDAFDEDFVQKKLYNVLGSNGFNIPNRRYIDVKPYEISIGADDIVEAVQLLEFLKNTFISTIFPTTAKDNVDPSQYQIFIKEYDADDYDVVIINRAGDVEDELEELHKIRYKRTPKAETKMVKEAIKSFNQKNSDVFGNLSKITKLLDLRKELESEKEADTDESVD